MSGSDYSGIVTDGHDSSADMDYTNEMTAISAYFSGFFSQQCGGIARYQWAVGSGDDDKGSVLKYTDSGIVVAGNGSGYAQV